MSDMRAVPEISIGSLTADKGGYGPLKSTRDGALFTEGWRQRLIMDSRGYHVTVGAFSTGITGGGAGTILDLDQPEVGIAVPSGTAILPIRIHIQHTLGLAAADNDEFESLIAVDRVTALAFDGTWATAETIFNMRTDNTRSSNCTAKSECTADTTDPVLGIELARRVHHVDLMGTATTVFKASGELLYEPQYPPIIIGPGSLILYWGGTVAVEGFAQIEWVEIPSNWVT